MDFSIPVSKEPPSQPAMPPDRERARREEEKAAWKEQRVEEQNLLRAQEIRAQALDCSLRLVTAVTTVSDVLEVADEMAAYIKDGTKP